MSLPRLLVPVLLVVVVAANQPASAAPSPSKRITYSGKVRFQPDSEVAAQLNWRDGSLVGGFFRARGLHLYCEGSPEFTETTGDTPRVSIEPTSGHRFIAEYAHRSSGVVRTYVSVIGRASRQEPILHGRVFVAYNPPDGSDITTEPECSMGNNSPWVASAN
jgi:hypothetical protein